MAALHIAACRMYPAVIELILMNKRAKIDIQSPLHGTPLHIACLVGSVKIVQQLLLNGAGVKVYN
jgi:ankyrin repeat protein